MAVSVHWATGTVFCSPLSLLASNMGCIISKTKCSGFSKRNVSVRKHYILSIPVSDRSPKCLESKFWAEWGRRWWMLVCSRQKTLRTWLGKLHTLPETPPKHAFRTLLFDAKTFKNFDNLSRPFQSENWAVFRCFARLWCQFLVFCFSDNGRDRFNFLWNTRVFDEKSSKSGRIGFKNIGLLKAKHPYFWGQTSVLLPKEVRCFRFSGRKTP